MSRRQTTVRAVPVATVAVIATAIVVVLLWLHTGRTEARPIVVAEIGAVWIRDVIEGNGRDALDCQSVVQLMKLDIISEAGWRLDNEQFRPEDWSWHGELSANGRFVGVVTVDGSRRAHKTSFKVTFEDRAVDVNYRIAEVRE